MSMWIAIVLCCFFIGGSYGWKAGVPISLERPEGPFTKEQFVGIAGPRITQVELMPDFVTKANGHGRDCGTSAPIFTAGQNQQMLWIFDDTFTNSGLLSSSAGWAFNMQQPWSLYEEVDSNDSPKQFYPFTFFEQLYNNKQANPLPCCLDRSGCPSNNLYCKCLPGYDCNQRIAHWSSKPIQYNNTHILAFYSSLKIGWAADFTMIGLGAAWSQWPYTTAQRIMDGKDWAKYIFGTGDRNWSSFMDGRDGFQYFSYDSGICDADIYMARVPKSDFLNKAAYTFWNGNTFQADQNATQKIGSYGGGLGSCMWSDYLKKYVAFTLGICNGASGSFRTADNVWGPWSDSTDVDLAPVGAIGGSYAGVIHQELNSGNTAVISYFVPAPNFQGRIVMRRVHFA